MAFLKFAILTMVCSSLVLAEASDTTFDLDRIKTQNGRVYEDILILDSDQHGLLFRHAVGIAKVDFQQLSTNLRMLYEPVVEEEEMVGEVPESDPEAASLLNMSRNVNITVTARNRVEVPVHHWNRSCATACDRYQNHWPSHWSRYNPALSLAVPECRALAVQDFLITTGLAHRPPGVTTYRLPFNRPYRLY